MTNLDLEVSFDPSDVDAAQQLAYKTLRLMKICARVLQADNNNMLMGRDDNRDLGVAIIDCASALGFFYQPSAEEVAEMMRFLRE